MALVAESGTSQDCGLLEPQQPKCAEDVLRGYFQKFGEQSQLIGLKKEAFGQGDFDQYKTPSGNVVVKALIRELGLQPSQLQGSALAENHARKAEDSDGEELNLCHQCNLPLGHKAYRRDRKFFHGECMAQMMVHTMKDDDKAKHKEDRQKKQACREEYGIGWGVHHIPRNEGPAGKLAMRQVPEGLVCLVLDDETNSICLASTTEPAAAVNLDYLSTTLEVRRREGHEPVFSLDPVDPKNRNTMQAKVFVPDWLAGTSVGEVLFQADYHLKELSMGEYEQPVVGMKSCFDYSEMDGKDFGEWNGREWFLVRKAEVQISESNILMPCVKMGVEAREQVIGSKGLEDKQITRPDHPMVRYAEAFTKNFDLIAERKSVIFHLRELAKASVLAKHLLDAGVELDASWFQLGQNEFPCSLEVPQLWNERFHSQVHVQDGAIVRDRDEKNSGVHGVYGGVMFGLDRFNLAVNVARITPMAGKLSLPLTTGIARQPLAASMVAGKLNLAVSAARQGVRVVTPGLTTTPVTAEAGGGSQPVLVSEAATGAALVTTGRLPVPELAAPSLAASMARQSPATAMVAAGKPSVAAASSMDNFGLSTARVTPPPAAVVARRPVLSAHVALAGNIPAGIQHRVAFDLSKKASVAPISSIASMVSGAAFAAPTIVAPATDVLTGASRRAARVAIRPLTSEAAPRLQGVDLRLDNFDLSGAKRVSLEAQAGSWNAEAKSLDECLTVGTAFWHCLEDGLEQFPEGDQELLKDIFNPELSDRRCEGERFVPPDASYSNVTKLLTLVREEEKVRQRRKDHFFSKDFSLDCPGPLFPASWAPSFEIAHGRVPHVSEGRRQGALRPRPEFKGQAAMLLLHVLKTAEPNFDRITEEGLRFLIYQLGNLEVRTTQDFNGEETIGAVFSTCTPELACEGGLQGKCIQDQERIMKATEYVERICVENDNGPSFSCHYYVVFETETSQTIVTERLSGGNVEWNESPSDLDVRCSLAKVTRSVERCASVTVKDMKVLQCRAATDATQTGKASASARKRYARRLFNAADKTNTQKGTLHLDR